VSQRRQCLPFQGGASIISKYVQKDPIQVEVHAAMMKVPLDTGFYPERCKQEVDVMLEKVPGISRSDKLQIIQLVEADIKQVLRIAFARNITRLAKEHEGIIS
jgi:hypothetical protein